MFVADTQNNRICRLEFSATSHFEPCKVTEHITGLADPWDVVGEDGVLYVSERKAHRICAYDMDTGAFIRVVVQGAPLAVVDKTRLVVRTAPLATCRAATCVAPEGLFLQDGWLYWGSLAQAQVKRINLPTGVIEWVCDVLTDNNSRYAKIAISDGTFGPRGAAFTWSWSNQFLGHAEAKTPDGLTWRWLTGNGDAPGAFANFNYATAGAVANGRMVSGGAGEGLMMATLRQPGDTVPSAAAIRGGKDYAKRGLHLLHGQSGYGFWGLPLPWGTSADIDAYLLSQGHQPPAAA